MTSGARTPWYRALSLRSRMILATTAIVTAVLAIGGYLILWAVEAELTDTADEVGLISASEIARLVSDGSFPKPLPIVIDPEAVVEVVSNGRILTRSENSRGAWALGLPEESAASSQVLEVDTLPVPEAGPYRVTALGVNTARGPATVYVAVSVEDLEDTMDTAATVLSVGLACLVLALCGVMWLVIGRTLAPVERIRQQASEITAEHLDRRVLEPAQQDEIGRLARTVNSMLDRLEASAERQNRFVADAAHELRSPVASLRTQLEISGPLHEGQGVGAAAPGLLQETLRMQAMIDRLLLLARTDAGELAPQLVRVDLDDTVEDVVSYVVTPRVSIDVAGVRPAQVTGDPQLLEQVVRNLVENAVRHAQHQVRMDLRTEGSEAVLTVDDDGAGIPEDYRLEVFERFTRIGDARDRHGGGVGLGLAIVTEIVRAHDGRIEVDRAPLGGARFRVRLPSR